VKILLVEDDYTTACAIAEILQAQNYFVDAVVDGQQALDMSASFSYDLMLLDLMLPKLDGISVCRALRSRNAHIPILLMTAKDTATDKIMGLDAGADDYLVKPFNVEELMARIRALLRRGTTVLPDILTWGNLQFDANKSDLVCHDKVLHLSKKDHCLIELFLRHPQKTFSRSEILDHLCAQNEYPSEAAVTTQIKALRKKLNAVGIDANFIETVYGFGYRLGKRSIHTEVDSGSEQILQVEDYATEHLPQGIAQSRLDKFKSGDRAKILLLEQACQALQQGQLDPQQQQTAQQTAHKLVGSLGILGFAAGSKIARKIERLLDPNQELPAIAAEELQGLVINLTQELARSPQPGSATKSVPSKAKVMIVDDDPQLLAEFGILLESHGIYVTSLLDANRFWQVLEAAKPALLVLDFQMPSCSGLDLCQLVRRNSQWQDLPIVFLTAHNSPEIIQQIFTAGADGYIKKSDGEIEIVNQIIGRLNWKLQSDNHERQIADTELKCQEHLFRTLAECSPVGIFMMDSSFECTYTNPRSHKICGFTAEQALGKGWLDFIHPDDREMLLAQLMEARKHTLPFEHKTRFVHKDTSILSGNIRTSPVVSSSGQLIGHVGTIEDITKAQMVEQMKDEFIAIVSHEIRTPLTGIRGALGLMATGALASQPARAKRILEIAVADTERLVRLVGDVLDLERLESGIDKLVRAHCRIDALIAQATEALQIAAEQAQVTLKLYPVSFELWVDGDLIVQALINLISNAIKFSPPGGVVTVRSILRAEHILFRVEDQGTGIPADKLESIFGRFQQVNASDSRQKGGTGLGLAICRNIIQRHGGYIWAESTLGEESIFSFTLPYTHP
jgi:PAS domain S-box-containing protein